MRYSELAKPLEHSNNKLSVKIQPEIETDPETINLLGILQEETDNNQEDN